MPEQNLEYRLSSVSVKSFSEQDIDLPDEAEIGYHVALGFDFNPQARCLIIGTKSRVAFIAQSDAEPETFMDLEAHFVFEFKDLEPALDESGQPKLDRPFLATLLGIALSTTRGLLVGRSRYGELEGAPLPVQSSLAMVAGILEKRRFEWVAD